MARQGNPYWIHGTTSLLVAGAGTIGVWWVCSAPWTWPAWMTAWLVAINGTAFGYYGFDKARAQSGSRRVPELVLQGLALIGGSLGAYLGMRLFRHKTLKGAFRVLFWVIVVLQLALIAVLVKEWMSA